MPACACLCLRVCSLARLKSLYFVFVSKKREKKKIHFKAATAVIGQFVRDKRDGVGERRGVKLLLTDTQRGSLSFQYENSC